MRKNISLEIWMKNSFFFRFNLTLGNYFKIIILIINQSFFLINYLKFTLFGSKKTLPNLISSLLFYNELVHK